jgi:hypothetical protein
MSLRTNHGLDATLAILLLSLAELPKTKDALAELPADIVIPLMHVLPALASAHPDPSTRHVVFRILALALSHAPPMLRFDSLLQMLTKDEDDGISPQMRVAAVGLVKEALMDSLRASKRGMLDSPLFFQVFGPILFRPDPSDAFVSGRTVNEILESGEAARLAECLSLYYVLLKRDTENRVRRLLINSALQYLNCP